MNNKIRKEFALIEKQLDLLQQTIDATLLTEAEKVCLGLMITSGLNGFIFGKIKSLNHNFDDTKAVESTMAAVWEVLKEIKGV